MEKRVEIPLNCLFQACYNPVLEEEIRRCKEKCWQFNQTNPNDRKRQRQILEGLLGGMGEEATFNPAFWCDYGYHIFVGDFFYANHNLVITDGAEVVFGNHVFIGPNCCFTTGREWKWQSPFPWAVTYGSAQAPQFLPAWPSGIIP